MQATNEVMERLAFYASINKLIREEVFPQCQLENKNTEGTQIYKHKGEWVCSVQIGNMEIQAWKPKKNRTSIDGSTIIPINLEICDPKFLDKLKEFVWAK